jgi:hypothetical protein
MENSKVNIDSIYKPIYDIIKLRRKYNMASYEKISQTKTVFNTM